MENKRVLVLHQMWMDGKTYEEIGKRFGVAASTIYWWSRQYKLPKRPKPMKSKSPDPTPEEIAERAAECRARHLAERRAESPDSSRTKARLARGVA